MFASKRQSTVIAEGLKIVGSVTAEGLIEVNGRVDGDLHCAALVIAKKALIVGTIVADRIVVDGRVEGPIQAGEVVLKSQAHVIGDIKCQTLIVERGAFIEGRLMHASAGTSPLLDDLTKGRDLEQERIARGEIESEAVAFLARRTEGEGKGALAKAHKN